METRTICQNAVPIIKNNTKRLLIIMYVGIAMALFGMYIRSNVNSDPGYVSPLVRAYNWMHKSCGGKILHPFHGCAKKVASQANTWIMGRYFLQPAVNFSCFINGVINLVQIILLKVNSSSLVFANAIGALSMVGLVVSMVCLVGAFTSCKMMCISCLGIQHVAIMYLIYQRRKLLMNNSCPSQNATMGACTFGTGSSSVSSSNVKSSARTNDFMRRRPNRA